MKKAGKIYFWFLLTIDILGYLINFAFYKSNLPIAALILCDLILSATVLYTFYKIVFEKQITHLNYLKIFLPIFLIWEISIFYIFKIHLQTDSSSILTPLIAWLIYLPEYVVVGLFVFRRRLRTDPH